MDKSLREFIFLRAGHCCEYCLFPAEHAEPKHQIDHIIAEKHSGRTISENLALACFRSNNEKGPCIAGIDPDTGEMTRLFHPRWMSGTNILNGTGRFLLA